MVGESISGEHVALTGADGGGDDLAESVAPEVITDAGECAGGQRRRPGEGHEVGQVVAAAPTSGAHAGAANGEPNQSHRSVTIRPPRGGVRSDPCYLL